MSAALALPADLVSPTVRALVTGGLDGALRVVGLLRARRYEVSALAFADGGGDLATFTCTVALEPGEVALLVARLQRLPSVLTAVAG
jgi:hypothetical protein